MKTFTVMRHSFLIAVAIQLAAGLSPTSARSAVPPTTGRVTYECPLWLEGPLSKPAKPYLSKGAELALVDPALTKHHSGSYVRVRVLSDPGSKALNGMEGFFPTGCTDLDDGDLGQATKPASKAQATGVDSGAVQAAYDCGRFSEAMELGRPLAERGDGTAQYILANILRERREFARSFRWLQAAAKQGHAPAQLSLAYFYLHGDGVPKDSGAADLWYGRAFASSSKAAQGTDPEAKFRLAQMFAYGSGTPKDALAAREWELKALRDLQKQADAGNPSAQTKLARAYASGKAVEKDAAKAKELYRKAADQGYALASLRLAELIEPSPTWGYKDPEAARLVRTAAEGGCAHAYGSLLYSTSDREDALLWQQKSSEEKGTPGSYYSLGEAYAALERHEEAAVSYRKAAEAGDDESQLRMGTISMNGTGVPKDEEEGLRWFQLSSESGNYVAMGNLVFYYKQRGDKAQALKWAILSKSERGRKELESSMTTDQIEDAKRQAAEFVINRYGGNLAQAE